jgi:hypothetical protein
VLQELETETNSVKKEEYVPRHIELTAVLREILKQRIRVIESRFENH